MVEHVKTILEDLELPYRILRLCGGDLGFTSALTYDFEIYSTAQKRWLEISSISTFNSFQAERLQMRYKTMEGKKQSVHTLNEGVHSVNAGVHTVNEGVHIVNAGVHTVNANEGVRTVNEGVHTLNDFENARAEWVKPISKRYRNVKI